MTKQKWHSGPPPSIGWWPASAFCAKSMIRWWNGSYWSWPAIAGSTADAAGRVAYKKSDNQLSIKWTERWWE